MPDDHKDDVLKGILYVCASYFCFTMMQALAKLLTDRHDVIEIAFWRNVVAIVPFGLYMLLTRQYNLFKTTKPYAVFFRAFIGTGSLVLTFWAVQLLPVSNATVLFFAATLMIPVFAHIFLHEYIGMHRWIAIVIGMCGVILVARPTADLTILGVLVALGAACSHTIIQITLRHLKTESPLTVTFYFVLAGAVLPGLAMPWVYDAPNADEWGLLLAIGAFGGVGQIFLSSAFKYAPASVLAPFGYTGLIWATLLDVLIWDYVPTWPVYVGGGIIIASKLYIIHRERKIDGEVRSNVVSIEN